MTLTLPGTELNPLLPGVCSRGEGGCRAPDALLITCCMAPNGRLLLGREWMSHTPVTAERRRGRELPPCYP